MQFDMDLIEFDLLFQACSVTIPRSHQTSCDEIT